jgi:acetyl-CoA acetyltransferase
VCVLAQAVTTDTAATFDASDKAACAANLCGFEISARAARMVYAAAGVRPGAVDVAEVHDAFASNELAMYEARTAQHRITAWHRIS